MGLTGVYGRTNGAIVKQGYLFDTQPCEHINAIEQYDIPGKDAWSRKMSQADAEKLIPTLLKVPTQAAVWGDGYLWFKPDVNQLNMVKHAKRTIYMCTRP